MLGTIYLSAVAQYLKENGHRVNLYTEQEFLTNPLDENLFSMMRSKAVRNLQKVEKKGVVAVNSAFGIEIVRVSR